MLKVLKRIFGKEKSVEVNNETTKTESVNTACRRNIEFYDKFVVVKNEKDDIIEAIIETYTYEYEPEEERLEGKGSITIDLPKCIINVSLVENQNSIGEFAATHIINRDPSIDFKIKLYTTKGLIGVITEPTEVLIDRFKVEIKQKN